MADDSKDPSAPPPVSGLRRDYYRAAIGEFLTTPDVAILGQLTLNNDFSLEQTQRDAWLEEIRILQGVLNAYDGSIYFEYSIPRMGRRVDVVLLIGPVIFVLEFKVGEKDFQAQARDQVWDYGLDLKNFHETSHDRFVAPILIATQARSVPGQVLAASHGDKLLDPIHANPATLGSVLADVLRFASGGRIDPAAWESGRYRPTPTIIEAAIALYNGHSVADISRHEAGNDNLGATSAAISDIIRSSQEHSRKSICFVTGVPGAGKTLVGLNVANKHMDRHSQLHSVYLSGNGPLVAILREALARDQVSRDRALGRKTKKGEALGGVKAFIQNVHHFRDECLVDIHRPPIEHVALFDEAQRAWTLEQTANFMLRRKRIPGFSQSEPEFLISCLDRHPDWAVVVCLVGGGQEINTGEAGISEWFAALNRSFPDWDVHISSRLEDSEYNAGRALGEYAARSNVFYRDELHLAVSMRSFRAENVSRLVKQVLDLDDEAARGTLAALNANYPILLTRNLGQAKQWLRDKSRGTERYGIVVSSQAERLKPHAIDVKSPMDPIHWFLDGKDDVRSSFYLEDVATEFHVQGLELDWACVTWDADFRHAGDRWDHWSFVGDHWNRVRKPERQMYLKNAYRVLLTRARQGMVIVVPEGDRHDQTRKPEYYDSTYDYLQSIGFQAL